VWIDTDSPVDIEAAGQALIDAPGITVIDSPADKAYPMPLFVADKDDVYVGRLRADITDPCGLTMWVVGDQIKKGAALNAVQIAQYLLDHDWKRSV
ncbi:MAG: aspartate-semialdehyde dehydrogenase, partial [Muribaculaceae bacterium]|nr:aspartate-semialdehyde dehydrogenase [Muribaculaceae bacterium]